MTTKIALTQINTGSTANVAVTTLPPTAVLTAGDNISIAANGRISSTATGSGVSESFHPFLSIGI